ncbi:helix-turn-helix domain-containing protein [Candidatus Dojkabacteria bacterium]|uniref:Helix-turn-helix domain-containing protein n=1 Tax=Candidatus Dojkabacteria bacterium TaxID=2099670 RepID=A0A5C7JAS1_9BACT|nr:MAG: helix-turn-helix domain-containing protein [Candidatus Dojkabacteria bacterium]
MIRIGQQFEEERKRKGLNLEEVSRATKIREDFLRAIEKGDFRALPSSAYAYGFVRNYAKFLGLPVEKSLALYRREFDEKKQIEVLPRGLANPNEYKRTKFKIGKSVIIIGVVFVLIAFFLLFQYRGALFNPSLKIETPKENQSFKTLTIEVTGKTDPDSTLTVENQQITLDRNGNFTKEITVFPGNTTITFTAENRFGRTTVLKRDIIVKPD